MCSSGISADRDCGDLVGFHLSFWDLSLSLPSNDHKDPHVHGCAEKDRKRRGMIIHTAISPTTQKHVTVSLKMWQKGTNGDRVCRYDLTLSCFRAGSLKTETTIFPCVINAQILFPTDFVMSLTCRKQLSWRFIMHHRGDIRHNLLIS